MTIRRIPVSYGQWQRGGAQGNSLWIPDEDYIPFHSNLEHHTWGSICHHWDLPGVMFNDRLPDFTYIEVGTDICRGACYFQEGFTSNRYINFCRADWIVANEGYTHYDVENFRYKYYCTWHEEFDTKTMRLVFGIVHNNITHTGGISVLRFGVDDITPHEKIEPHEKIDDKILGEGYYCIRGACFEKEWEGQNIQFVFDNWTGNDKPATEEQYHAYVFFITHQEDFKKTLEEAIRKYPGDMNAKFLKENHALEAIVFRLLQPNKKNCLGILCSTPLDPEHGLGILVQQEEDGYSILRIGDQGVAI